MPLLSTTDPLRAEPETGPSSDHRAVALHAHPLSRLDRLAGQIHFQFRRPGFILQNKPSLRRICPPDGPFQTDGMADVGIIRTQAGDLQDIGHVEDRRAGRPLLCRRGLCHQSCTQHQAATSQAKPGPRQEGCAHAFRIFIQIGFCTMK